MVILGFKLARPQVTSARFFLAKKKLHWKHPWRFFSHKAAQLLFPWPAWPGRCVDDSCPSSTRPWPPKPPRPPSCRAKPRKRAWCFSSSEVSWIPKVIFVRPISPWVEGLRCNGLEGLFWEIQHWLLMIVVSYGLHEWSCKLPLTPR